MARPVSIKDETIIAAAREVFLERGKQATTAEVAERAGVSEGSIFKRFKSKDELFHAAMGDPNTELPWVKNLAAHVGKGNLEDALVTIGLDIVAFFRALMPLMMMAWSNPAANGLPKAIAGPNPPPLRALKALSGFFEAEMRAGRLRRHDPEVVARTMLGGCTNYVFFELLFQASGELPLAPETYVRGLVSLLWKGIAPIETAEPKNAPPRRAGRGKTRS